MPKLVASGYRVRVAVGRSGEIESATDTPEEISILDGTIEAKGCFQHRLPADRAAWIYAVSGELSMEIGGSRCVLPKGSAVMVADAKAAIDLVIESCAGAHFVLMASRPLREAFVKHGPLVMSSITDVRRTLDDYAAGRFGSIPA
jgi:redox-sensitive bicupin YhaK (pirin superfamily)